MNSRLLKTVLLVYGVGVCPVLAESSPTKDWSGFYVGVRAGAMQGNAKTRAAVLPGGAYFTETDPNQIAAAGKGRLSEWHLAGGIFAGYLKQFNHIVAGMEVDVNSLYLNKSRSRTAVYFTAPPSAFTLKQTVKAKWQQTIRMRLGYAQDNWLVSISAGPAMTRVKVNSAFSDDYLDSGAYGGSSVTKTRFGWALGLGSEYALNGAVSMRVDYLYTRFPAMRSSQIIRHPSFVQTSVIQNKATLSTHSMLVGLSYHF